MSDLTGQRLGQYQILSRIAKGSVATIYKAYQPKLDRYVAVKVLSPEVIDEEGFLDRFTQEARAIAQLDHPNIVPVYDFDRLGDTMYLVMKYVEGGTLKGMLAGKPLDLGLTVELISQVGLALGYAHKRGVIHRDVKPSNILIAEGHWALLTDFGLAKMIAGSRKLTRSGVGLGTPDYIAPEQAEGLAVDHRADLYSLGVMLYEMAVGRVPFESESSMAVIVKHITEPPCPPHQLNPDLPAPVEDVILTALEKKPDKRYQNAEDFIGALVNATRQAVSQTVPGASVAARGISGVGPDLQPAPEPPKSADGAEVRKQAHEVKPRGGLVERWAAVRDAARPRLLQATDQAKLTFTALWSQKIYRIALVVAAAIIIVGAFTFILSSGMPRWVVASAVTPTATRSPAQTSRPATFTNTVPRPTFTSTPKPTLTPTLTPTPTVTSALRYLSSGAKIVPGIYVKVVKPEGLNLHKAAGFDKDFITTISYGSILYVWSGPVRADNLSWLKMSDARTGTVGWGVQDNVVAYAAPQPTPTLTPIP